MLALAGQMSIGGSPAPMASDRRFMSANFLLPAFEKVHGTRSREIYWLSSSACRRKPRLKLFTSHLGARIIGVLMIAPMASILIPLPSTNTVPGIGVAVAALGLIERDGVLVILGLVIGLAWVALLVFLGLEAASLIKAWISGIF